MSDNRSAKAIGVTGGIAAGKSEVGRLLEQRGIPVLDTDEVAHRLMEPGTDTFGQIVERFSGRALDAEGRIDRSRLGEMVFENGGELEDLNGILHPPIREAVDRWMRERRENHRAIAVLIPLLFEAGFDEGWDAILCVAARQETMLARLKERGLTEEAAKRRIASQMPVPQKAERADYVIENDGSLEDLKRNTNEVLEKLLTKERETHA